MVTPGQFIVVEGLEGAGKSTIMQTIKDYLQPIVSKIIFTREPGGTTVGETIRQLIKKQISDEPLNKITELLLIYAARTQLLNQVIHPALQQGHWVISDRFELSTYAYQGGGRQIHTNILDQLSAISLQGFKPNLTFFLDIHPQEGLKRARLRGQIDRIESESIRFFEDTYFAYHQEITKLENVVIIDASQELEIVQQVVLTHLYSFLNTHANY